MPALLLLAVVVVYAGITSNNNASSTSTSYGSSSVCGHHIQQQCQLVATDSAANAFNDKRDVMSAPSLILVLLVLVVLLGQCICTYLATANEAPFAAPTTPMPSPALSVARAEICAPPRTPPRCGRPPSPTEHGTARAVHTCSTTNHPIQSKQNRRPRRYIRS